MYGAVKGDFVVVIGVITVWNAFHQSAALSHDLKLLPKVVGVIRNEELEQKKPKIEYKF